MHPNSHSSTVHNSGGRETTQALIKDDPRSHEHTRTRSLQPCPAPCGPMNCSLSGSSLHGDSPDKNTGVGRHALLQGIFPTQGLTRVSCVSWTGRWVLIAPPGKPLPFIHFMLNLVHLIRFCFQLFFFFNATAGTENIFAQALNSFKLHNKSLELKWD